MDPIEVIVRRGTVVEAIARRARGRRARRRGDRGGGRSRPRRVPPLLGEAVPGAAARPRARRPDDGGDRDRLRLAPRLARAARRRPQLAREGARPRRTSSSAVREPTAMQHNCSGKHAGMLALCRTKGWASGGYRLATHPVQHGCLHEVAAAADADPDGDPDRDRRLRRAHLRPAARADGADVLPPRADRGRRAGGRGDARPPRADPRPDGRRQPADA